jgi:protein-tyrosine phosphatase
MNVSSVNNRGSALKKFFRPLVPQRLREERDVFSRLGPAGLTYLRLRLLNAMGIRQADQQRAPSGTRSFLFVCYGNIMRSPMAELMLRRAALERGQAEIKVSSAGIHTTPETEAHPRARIAARKLGISLDGHRSRLLTAEMVAQSDVIFVMDFQNQAELLTEYPDARDKILLLSAYAEGVHRYSEIPDPYFGDQDAACHCYAVLHTCVNNLARSLWTDENQSTPQQVAHVSQ